MRTFISLVLFVAGALAQLTINTPANVVECQPTLLSWSGGTAPYYLSILPGATPTGTAIESLGELNSTSVTWICNIPSGTSIGLTLVDSTGTTAQSAPFTVNPGTSTSCTNTTSLVSGPTVQTTAAGSTTAPGTTVGTTATSHVTSTTTTGSASKSSGSTTAASSTSTSAAYVNVVRVGAAVAAGAAVAGLLF